MLSSGPTLAKRKRDRLVKAEKQLTSFAYRMTVKETPFAEVKMAQYISLPQEAAQS